MEIGKLIKEFRKKRNMSQRQFATFCGVSNGYISMLEEGKNPKTKEPIVPSVATMKKIATAMGITLNELMDAVDEMNISMLPVSDIPPKSSAKGGNMNIGKRIKEERRRKGFSQEYVANAIETTKQAIYKYESGIVTNIPTDKISKMAALFGVTPAYLMGWDEDAVLTELPLSGNATETDPLWVKITKLDNADRDKVDAYTDGLLAAEKYQEHTQQLKIAARGGGIKEITVTDSQLQEIMNLPQVTSLDDNS